MNFFDKWDSSGKVILQIYLAFIASDLFLEHDLIVLKRQCILPPVGTWRTVLCMQ